MGYQPPEWVKEMQQKHALPFKPRRKSCLTKPKLSAVLFPCLAGSEMFRSKIVTHSAADFLAAVLHFYIIPSPPSTSVMLTYTWGKKKTFKKYRFHTTLHRNLSKFCTIDQLTIFLSPPATSCAYIPPRQEKHIHPLSVSFPSHSPNSCNKKSYLINYF